MRNGNCFSGYVKKGRFIVYLKILAFRLKPDGTTRTVSPSTVFTVPVQFQSSSILLHTAVLDLSLWVYDDHWVISKPAPFSYSHRRVVGFVCC